MRITIKNRVIILLALLVFAGTSLQAQKYGHLNFGNVIAALPETKNADDVLAAYQKKLVEAGEKMASSFQANYTKFVEMVQSGSLNPGQQQEEEKELQKRQQEILDYEQSIPPKLQGKRDELLQPIIDKVNLAIKKIARANGYIMVFDTSIFNAILFAGESEDLMPLVRAELRISN